MKNALYTGLLALGMSALVGTGIATAETPTVPTACLVTFYSTGPARVAHSAAPAQTQTTYDGPLCMQVAGICLVVSNVPSGPGRVVHGQPTHVAGEPCVPLDKACLIPVDYNDYKSATGEVIIPKACYDLMVLAQSPEVGSETWPTVWIATAFLGAGAVLVLAPRRLAHR